MSTFKVSLFKWKAIIRYKYNDAIADGFECAVNELKVCNNNYVAIFPISKQ